MALDNHIVSYIIDEVRRLSFRNVGPETALTADDLLDSLAMVELLISLQNEFAVGLDLSLFSAGSKITPLLLADLVLRAKRGP